jgi:hypothetical protein
MWGSLIGSGLLAYLWVGVSGFNGHGDPDQPDPFLHAVDRMRPLVPVHHREDGRFLTVDGHSRRTRDAQASPR